MKKLWFFCFLLLIIACCDEDDNGIYYSYVQIDDPSFIGRKIYDIDEIYVDGEHLLVAVGESGSWTSIDGLKWNHHDGPDILKMVDRSSVIFAISLDGKLFKSSDGINWDNIDLGDAHFSHISRINAGGLLVVGQDLETEDFCPAVWIYDGINWVKHILEFGADKYAYVGAHDNTTLIVGGAIFEDRGGLENFYPRFWYSHNNGSNWNDGWFNISYPGIIEQVVVGNDTIFASAYTLTGGRHCSLWRSTTGQLWHKCIRTEVATGEDYFNFNDVIYTGLDNVTDVVGMKNDRAAIWWFSRSNEKWFSGDATSICGESLPPEFTCIGLSTNIGSGFVYAGYGEKDGIWTSAIWIKQPVED